MVKQSMDLLELLPSAVWTRRGLSAGSTAGPGGRHHGRRGFRIGAQHGERSPERVSNGYRNRTSRVGTMRCTLREGSYFPSLLEPRRRSEQALKQAYPSAGSGQAWRESPPVGWMT